MKEELFMPTNKKAGNGNGNSVINNYEHSKNKASDYVSGDSTPSSAGHKTVNSNQQ